MNAKKKINKYYIYIISCDGERLYTGITTDYKRRFCEHLGTGKNKKGAKFTRSFKPNSIMALWKSKDRSTASKLEYQIKKLKRTDKILLIENNKWFEIFFNDICDTKQYKRQYKI